jgi:hypothetical protein
MCATPSAPTLSAATRTLAVHCTHAQQRLERSGAGGAAPCEMRTHARAHTNKSLIQQDSDSKNAGETASSHRHKLKNVKKKTKTNDAKNM